jgi:hypothetical protein
MSTSASQHGEHVRCDAHTAISIASQTIEGAELEPLIQTSCAAAADAIRFGPGLDMLVLPAAPMVAV